MASQPASVLLAHACAEPPLGLWDVVGVEVVHAVPLASVGSYVACGVVGHVQPVHRHSCLGRGPLGAHVDRKSICNRMWCCLPWHHPALAQYCCAGWVAAAYVDISLMRGLGSSSTCSLAAARVTRRSCCSCCLVCEQGLGYF